MKKFVLAAIPRSGSNYVVETLNLHPDVLCHYELARRNEVTQAVHLQDKLTLELRKEDPQAFVDLAFTPSRNQSAVGFKIFIHDDENIFDIILSDDAADLIILERKNRLASFSSQEIAMQTNVWGSNRERGSEQQRVVFDANKFSKYCDTVDNYYQNLESTLERKGRRFVKIDYLKIKDPGQVEGIFEFLGVDSSFLGVPARKKQNSPSIIERFTNAGDVAAHLEKTGHTDWKYERTD